MSSLQSDSDVLSLARALIEVAGALRVGIALYLRWLPCFALVALC